MDLTGWIWLVLARSVVTEHLQPMRVGLASQQLGRTLVNALGMFAAQKAAMIEEELQQLQIARAHVPTQEKIAAQSAVDVLDDRTGADYLLAQSTHGLFQRVEQAT